LRNGQRKNFAEWTEELIGTLDKGNSMHKDKGACLYKDKRACLENWLSTFENGHNRQVKVG